MSNPVRLLRTQASQLIENGMLTTTHAKALKVRNYLSRLLPKLSNKDIASRRLLEASLFGEKIIKKAFALPDAVKIKLYHMGQRVGDQAPMTRLVLELPKTKKEK